MTGIAAGAAVRVQVPLRHPLVTALGSWDVVDSWLVQLTATDGRTGLGEATLGPGADPADQADLDARVRALVSRPGLVVGEQSCRPAEMALRAAVDGAWLDIGDDGETSRAASVSINALIGVESLDASVAAALEATADGFTTLKLKGGGEASTAELVERLRAVRAAVGPVIRLRLDVNGAWSAAVALERLAALAPLELELVEQPVAPGPDVADVLAELRASTGVALGADESVTSLRDAGRLLDVWAVDALVVKPARVGGRAVALAIAALARSAGVGVIISTLLETGVGLRAALVTAAMLPDGSPELAHGLATGPLLATDLVLGGGVTVTGGRAACPRGPGLGLTLDPAAVERSVVAREGTWR